MKSKPKIGSIHKTIERKKEEFKKVKWTIEQKRIEEL
jgi:hypothetical protein